MKVCNWKTLLSSCVLSLSSLGYITYSQIPNPSASPTKEAVPERGLLKLTMPRLKDELVKAEIEPRSKQFQMNLRFMRAKYSRPGHEGQQYDWSYFPEAVIAVAFYQYSAGHFSSMSAEESRTQVWKIFESDLERVSARKVSEKDIKIGSVLGKEVEVSLQGKMMKVRTFAYRDVRYVLIAQPKTDDANALIQKLFDSFEFVTDSK